MYKKILVPIDLAEKEMVELSLKAALAFARTGEARLRLVNVQPPAPLEFLNYIPPTLDAEMLQSAEKQLAGLAATLGLPRERLSSIVRYGAVYPEVLAEAEDWAATLIVIGSHRPTMATYLLGSSAAAIVRHAKCSVLVVRERIPSHSLEIQ